MSDDEVLERNASAYCTTTALFVGSLFASLPFYYVLGVDDQEPWPAITSLVLSVLLPLSYLTLRCRTGGPTIEEFLRYCELKDGFSRRAQIAIFAAWVVFVVVAVAIVLVMSLTREDTTLLSIPV
ncbi:MAG: hypothetical protein FGM43_05765 [Sinobacteraceae bacterium]|nr:hypothetical protein [Nevskiaceae bacterium]